MGGSITSPTHVAGRPSCLGYRTAREIWVEIPHPEFVFDPGGGVGTRRHNLRRAASDLQESHHTIKSKTEILETTVAVPVA